MGLAVVGANRRVSVPREHAEEELELRRRLEERVAFHVEEDVAGRGRREKAEAFLLNGLEQVSDELAGVAAVELEPGLVAEPLEHGPSEPLDLQFGRRRGELRKLLDAGTVQPLDLIPPNRGDERQVVVVLPLFPADRDEVAARAVVAGPGIEVGRRRVEVRAEPPLRGAEERIEVTGSVGLDDPGAGHNVQPLGKPSLDLFDLVRVEDKLKHSRRFRGARELGVPGFVAPIPELGGLVDADDEVGQPAPPVAREGRLVDHLDAVAHRLLCRACRLIEPAVAECDPDDLAPFRLQPGEVRRFV